MHMDGPRDDYRCAVKLKINITENITYDKNFQKIIQMNFTKQN